MQTASTILDPPLGSIAPTVMTDTTGPGSPDGPFEDTNIHAEGANAMQSGKDDKTTPLPAAGANEAEVADSEKKRTRKRELWFRGLSPVRTRTSTGSLPRRPQSSRIQTFFEEVEDVTPIKPRKRRATLNTTPAVKKSNPTRKRKSALIGRAPKRSRKSVTPGDKQVGGGAGNGRQAAEIDGKDDESDYEHNVKTPGVSDDEASSTGLYYEDPETDACAKPDEPAPKDGVKTPGISGDEASSPPRFYERDSYSYAKSEEFAPGGRFQSPGVSSDVISSPSGSYQYADDYVGSDGAVLLRNRIKTPGISDDEASSPGGYQEQEQAHAKHIGCGQKDGARVLNNNEGSTNFRADEDGAEGFKEPQAAIPDDKLNLWMNDLAGYQAEDGPRVQSHHDSVEPKAKPELSQPRCHGPDKRTDAEAQKVTHPDQAPEVADFVTPFGIEFALIVPTRCLTPEDFIENIKTFRFQNKSEHHSGATHLFIYFASPASQIQFVASVSRVGVAPSPPIDGNEGTGPGVTDHSSTDHEYEVTALWQLAEGIPLVRLQEAYECEGPPPEAIEVSLEFLDAHPKGTMHKIF